MRTIHLKSIFMCLLVSGILISCGSKEEKEEASNETETTEKVEEATDELKGEMSLEKTTFVSGETISLTFKVSQNLDKRPWIGVIPSDIPHGDESQNDQHDVAYQYFDNKTEGTLEFKAPAKAGKYDFRMHTSDSNGEEISSVSFEVTEGTASGITGQMRLAKTSYKAGEAISLSFKVSENLSKRPWIGIIPSDIPHGDESQNDQHDVSYKYFDNKTEGTLEFKAPMKAGKYDFRMHTSDSNGEEISSISFEVTE